MDPLIRQTIEKQTRNPYKTIEAEMKAYEESGLDFLRCEFDF